MFMTAWVLEARHCPTLLNEIKKTRLQTYTEPQAGINIVCAPSMVRLNIPEGNINRLSEGCKSLMCTASMRIVSCKVVCREAFTEESRTTKICTEGHELYMRHVWAGELAHLNEALQVQ
jgi:hypothetical protein